MLSLSLANFSTLARIKEMLKLVSQLKSSFMRFRESNVISRPVFRNSPSFTIMLLQPEVYGVLALLIRSTVCLL